MKTLITVARTVFVCLTLLVAGIAVGEIHANYLYAQTPVIETEQASPSVVELSGTTARAWRIDSPTPVPTPAPATQGIFMYIFSNIMVILTPIVVAVTGVVVNGVLVIVANHFRLQISQTQHDLLLGFAQTGVAKAEAWAATQKDTPSSNDKLNVAMATLNSLAASQMGKSFETDTLIPYIEHAVATLFPSTPSAVTKA